MNSTPNKENKRPSNVLDILLITDADNKIDSTTLTKNIQTRVNKAIEEGYEYARVIDSSEKFLRKNVFAQIDMAVLYVDLVGSTKISRNLSAEKLSILISSFSQEMSYVIEKFGGFVLKFVGDAVIGYFVEDKISSIKAVDNAITCAEFMINVVKQGINPILVEKAGLSEISIKIGIDFGKNIVVRYGSDEKRAYVDLLGSTMNVASKIQNLAQPNQIIIGQDVYSKIHPYIQEFFSDITDEISNNWNIYSKESDQIYNVFKYKIK